MKTIPKCKHDNALIDDGLDDGNTRSPHNTMAVLGLEKLIRPLFAHLPEGKVRDDAYLALGERFKNMTPEQRLSIRTKQGLLAFVRAGIPKA